VTTPIDHIAELFAGEGLQSYLGEDVSIAVHMLQAGALAERAGAAEPLIAAALLHDVGHFAAVGHRPRAGQQPEAIDFRHQDSGADWLARWFPMEVSEPVRLHVTAKRYLCAVEPDYLARLSPASVQTLSLQGGPLTATEADAFAPQLHAQAAISVRRWDDEAKDPTRAAPPFEHFRQLLSDLLRAAGHVPDG
jgi:gamma-butyrobetaine dioxygenase